MNTSFNILIDLKMLPSSLKDSFVSTLLIQRGKKEHLASSPKESFILDFFLTWDRSQSTMVSVQAIEDSVIYTTKYTTFLELTNKVPLWHEAYREILLKNYRKKTRREIEFVLYNAKERLLQCMENKYFDIARIPKTYLASYLGIAAPSLSRLLRELKNEKVKQSKD